MFKLLLTMRTISRSTSYSQISTLHWRWRFEQCPKEQCVFGEVFLKCWLWHFGVNQSDDDDDDDDGKLVCTCVSSSCPAAVNDGRGVNGDPQKLPLA